MARQPLNSSMISAAGYDPDTQRLQVEFKATHAVYEYSDVPQEVFDGLTGAESAGKYYNLHIAGKYPVKKPYQA